MSSFQLFSVLALLSSVLAVPSSVPVHVRIIPVDTTTERILEPTTTTVLETTTEPIAKTESQSADELPDGPPHVRIYPVSFRTARANTFADAQSRSHLPLPVHLEGDLTPGYVLAKSSFTCNGLADGYFADTTFGCGFFHNCHFFYNALGKMYIQHSVFACGEGTKFNQTTRTCDFAHAVNCNPENVLEIIYRQLAAPAPAPGFSTPVQMPSSSFRCPSDPAMQGFYYADVENRCRMYHRCVYHTDLEDRQVYVRHFRFLCPAGTIFDQKLLSCQHVEQVTECDNSLELVQIQATLH